MSAKFSVGHTLIGPFVICIHLNDVDHVTPDALGLMLPDLIAAIKAEHLRLLSFVEGKRQFMAEVTA